ncbi:hypothetical protein F5X96DRAFT_179890 [Biscogniauxia mediterranea]|nr:hypothetical protein F5X96DRAFT_179890 [Biscogniauxia mediterranea]
MGYRSSDLEGLVWEGCWLMGSTLFRLRGCLGVHVASQIARQSNVVMANSNQCQLLHPWNHAWLPHRRWIFLPFSARYCPNCPIFLGDCSLCSWHVCGIRLHLLSSCAVFREVWFSRVNYCDLYMQRETSSEGLIR